MTRSGHRSRTLQPALDRPVAVVIRMITAQKADRALKPFAQLAGMILILGNNRPDAVELPVGVASQDHSTEGLIHKPLDGTLDRGGVRAGAVPIEGRPLLLHAANALSLAGREAIETALFVGATLGVLAWRERRAGRPLSPL
jgi:hypothetical protein